MFQRFFDEGLAHASYLIACDRTREAAVVDPRRDVDVYVAAARQLGLTLTAAIETHIHADFVSGSRELGRLDARTIAGPGAALRFPFYETRPGERLSLGDLALEFLHTPGHTPEHISVLARHPGEPARLFTGDTLFVGAVGRPDLLGPEQTRRLAGDLYRSLFETLLALDDAVEVHPAHGAGSLCGTGIGASPYSTIGQERRLNPMLQHTSREPFVAAVLDDLPETPPYFSRMKYVNQAGPTVLGLADGYRGVAGIGVERAAAAVHAGATLIDLRSPDSFCASHPARALSLAYGSRIGYWAGWILPPDAAIVLLAANEREASEAGRQLLRVGFDDVEGFVTGGMDAWRDAGLPVSSIPQIAASDLRTSLAGGERLTVMDVRSPQEWAVGHIPGASHVPVGELGSHAANLPRDVPVATICEGGYRSALAASLLARAGVTTVVNVTGGMAAYRALPVVTK